MNTEYRPRGDFVARVMDRIEDYEMARVSGPSVLLYLRPVCYLLACTAPLLLFFRAAPVF